MIDEGRMWSLSEAAKLRTSRAERKAGENHRFRDFKTPEAKVLTAIVTSVMSLFIR